MDQHQDLPISQLALAIDLNGQEIIPFAKENENGTFANGAFTVELLKSIIREGLATLTAVNGKQNKLTPGYGIEITAENEIKTNLDVSPFALVDELPTSDIKNKIYCVPDPDGEVGKNERIEYMWFGDHWEVVGKFSPKVDLTDYLKSVDAERIYAKKSEIPDTSGFVTMTAANVMAEQIATLVTQMSAVQTRLNAIPALPLNDGKHYAMLNGQWTVIADVTESVLTAKNDFSETPANGDEVVQ